MNCLFTNFVLISPVGEIIGEMIGFESCRDPRKCPELENDGEWTSMRTCSYASWRSLTSGFQDCLVWLNPGNQTRIHQSDKKALLSLCSKIVVSMDTAFLLQLRVRGVQALSCESQTRSNPQKIY